MSNNVPGPPAAEYGADEISALVLDPGYSVIRAGFAGEDTPKSVIPTCYGVHGDSDAVFGENAIHDPKPDFEIKNPMSSEGIVEDWDIAPKMWEYAITSRLTVRPSPSIRENGQDNDGDVEMNMEDTEATEKPLAEFPLLMTEPGWNTAKNREKAIEIALEDWGCPAFFISRSGVLSSFASGKPSALVIDVGASTMSATPVYDGLMLRKGLMKSPLAGNWLSEQIRLIFSQSQPQVPLVPHYMITSKTPVDAGLPAQATYRTFDGPITDSFRRLQEERVLTEFKECCVQIWNPAANAHQPLSSSLDFIKAQGPGRSFEMPNGWNNVFGVDRYRAAEGMFDEKAAITDTDAPAPAAAQTLPALAAAALNAIDADIRSQVLANVVITGGGTLTQGFTDRVLYELQNANQGARVRLQAPGSVVERKYAGWIGGSILASLGSFHQMWISKREYDEQGAGILEKRCK